MGDTHCLVDRGRPPSFLVYSKSDNVDCAWVQLFGQYSHCTAISPNWLYKMRLCGVLTTKTYVLLTPAPRSLLVLVFVRQYF